MQTFTVEVHDSFIQDFLSFIEVQKEKIFIKKESNIDKDFLNEKEELHKTLEDYKKNGSKNFSTLNKEYWNETYNRLVERHS